MEEKEMKGGKQKDNNQNKSVGKVKEYMSLHLQESIKYIKVNNGKNKNICVGKGKE